MGKKLSQTNDMTNESAKRKKLHQFFFPKSYG